MNILIFSLISLQIKHFICDYPFQNNYMLGKFKSFPHYIVPLSAHSAVHAIGTLFLCFIFQWPLWYVLLDFVSHFVIDRLKASPEIFGRWKPDNKYFWWALGLDQFAHHMVGIFMIWWVTFKSVGL